VRGRRAVVSESGGIFLPFSLFPFFLFPFMHNPHGGDGRGERSSRTTLKQDNGPQQHAARDADTKKGGIRSAVPPSSWSSATGWSAREKLLQRLALMPRLLLPAPPVDPAAAAVADVWFSAAAALLLSSSRPSSVARWTRENVADDAEEHRLRRACSPSCSSGVLQQRIGVGGFSGNNNNTDVDRARHQPCKRRRPRRPWRSRAWRCSRRPCSDRARQHSSTATGASRSAPPRRVPRPVDAHTWATRRRPRPRSSRRS
jgi:hypothetical protein